MCDKSSVIILKKLSCPQLLLNLGPRSGLRVLLIRRAISNKSP